MHICAFVGMKSPRCQLQPHRPNTSHIFNLNLRTVHRGLTPLGQVKDCPFEFYTPWTGWGLRTVQVLLSWSGFVRDWPPLTRLCYRAFSVQNQCRIGCDMSRDEATHYTIGVSLPQNPFSLINFVFHVLFYSTAWVINQP